MKVALALITHPDCLLHDAGSAHPERPERVKVIQAALASYPFPHPVHFYQAPLATKEQLLMVHDQDYIDWIFSIAPKDGIIGIDADTWMNPYTLQAALRAAGAVLFAVDVVMRGEASAAFCNIRPPGHHAERDKAMGFCFFNNVAIGVMHALQHYGLQRVAIIDFDVHHGNGTQMLFQHNPHVLYCSSFEHPFYPGYEQELDNEHILNVPLPAGTSAAEFRQRVEAAWFEQLAAFKPEFIFISAGFDAHVNDVLADLNLTVADYVWLTEHIAKLAKVYCDGRIVSVLEGGYDLAALAETVPAHVAALVV